jgi:hypothetical protein
MGSKKTSRFADYSESPKTTKTGSGATEAGGTSPDDRCARAFSATLEDVEHSDHFRNGGSTPAVGTTLRIAHKKRVVAETLVGEIVGNLPTAFNYLAACLRDGFTYTGIVRTSRKGPPMATVTADFVAVPPP